MVPHSPPSITGAYASRSQTTTHGMATVRRGRFVLSLTAREEREWGGCEREGRDRQVSCVHWMHAPIAGLFGSSLVCITAQCFPVGQSESRAQTGVLHFVGLHVVPRE